MTSNSPLLHNLIRRGWH